MKRMSRYFATLLLGAISMTCLVRADETEVHATDSAVVAENNGEAEITFRGIPWGTTYGEILDGYNEFGIKENSSPTASRFLATPNDRDSKMDVYSNGYSVADGDEAGFEIGVGNYTDAVCTVAGYDVVKVEYGFVLSVDDASGFVEGDANKAKMYVGDYQFAKMNEAAVMVEDLIGKLSSIYGDRTAEDTDTYSSGETVYKYMWEDPEGNWIVLRHNDKPDEPDAVSIGYYCGQLFDWTEALTNAYNKEEAENFVAPEGVEGL